MTRAVEVRVTDDELIVHLADGRTVSVPLVWFPCLLHASVTERADLRILDDGQYINWPTLDEDVSVAGLLRGSGKVPNRGAASST
jgi:hypothetical protein